jgi:hypothetical protein
MAVRWARVMRAPVAGRGLEVPVLAVALIWMFDSGYRSNETGARLQT